MEAEAEPYRLVKADTGAAIFGAGIGVADQGVVNNTVLEVGSSRKDGGAVNAVAQGVDRCDSLVVAVSEGAVVTQAGSEVGQARPACGGSSCPQMPAEELALLTDGGGHSDQPCRL